MAVLALVPDESTNSLFIRHIDEEHEAESGLTTLDGESIEPGIFAVPLRLRSVPGIARRGYDDGDAAAYAEAYRAIRADARAAGLPVDEFLS